MSSKAHKTPPRAPRPPTSRSAAVRRHAPHWGLTAMGFAVAAVAIAVAVTLSPSKPSAPASALTRSGLAPAFSARDVLSGQSVTSAGLRGKHVLLFFSEGVTCQACFEQIQALQQDASQLRTRGLTLVSVTTDPPDVLRQAVMQYGITTPMISDATRKMSMAYGANGQGMHANTDGHTFLLIDATGHIRWRHDYTTMYVPPAQLLAAIPPIG